MTKHSDFSAICAFGVALFAWVAIGGCSDDDGENDCSPGDSRACSCSAGGEGTQYCGPGGTWDDCLGCGGGTCGDGTCDATETEQTCPEDCPPAGECGDGHVDPGETCDGGNLNSHDCTTLGQGFTGGTLACSATCGWDTAGCVSAPGCGNGVLDSGEVCDGQDFGGQSCADFGYSAGMLACRADCSEVVLTGCHATGVCGNGIVEGLEECDGADLQGLSLCNELEPAFTAGSLSCTAQCTYDLSGCSGDLCQWNGLYGNGYCDPCELYGGTPDPDCASCTAADGDCVSWRAPYLGAAQSSCVYLTGQQDPDCGSCGDGVLNSATEQCDGSLLPALVGCTDFGFTAGDLACHGNCTMDISGCSNCGNGVLDGPEVCDGANLDGATCVDYGFSGGSLACSPSCDAFDLSGCTGGCGNGVIDGAEACDGAALGGLDCTDQGFTGGTLACNAACSGLDTAGCYDPFVVDPSHPMNWVEISSTGQAVTLTDDDFAGPHPIGFTFHFFGTAFDDFFIGSNGYVTFGAGAFSMSNACPLSSDTILPDHAVALMWDDLVPDWFGDLAYFESFTVCPVGPAEPCLVVQYDSYHHYAMTEEIAGTFEAVLFGSGSVLLQFLDAGDRRGETATTGVKGPAGVGADFGCDTVGYLYDGLAICFQKPGSGGC